MDWALGPQPVRKLVYLAAYDHYEFDKQCHQSNCDIIVVKKVMAKFAAIKQDWFKTSFKIAVRAGLETGYLLLC